jgi:hypothetical protein
VPAQRVRLSKFHVEWSVRKGTDKFLCNYDAATRPDKMAAKIKRDHPSFSKGTSGDGKGPVPAHRYWPEPATRKFKSSQSGKKGWSALLAAVRRACRIEAAGSRDVVPSYGNVPAYGLDIAQRPPVRVRGTNLFLSRRMEDRAVFERGLSRHGPKREVGADAGLPSLQPQKRQQHRRTA